MYLNHLQQLLLLPLMLRIHPRQPRLGFGRLRLERRERFGRSLSREFHRLRERSLFCGLEPFRCLLKFRRHFVNSLRMFNLRLREFRSPALCCFRLLRYRFRLLR